MNETAKEVAIKLIKQLKVTVDIYKTSMDTLSKVIDIELEKLYTIPIEWKIIEIHNKKIPMIEDTFFAYSTELLTARCDFDEKIEQEQLKLEGEYNPDKYNFYISPLMTDFDKSSGMGYLKQRVGVVKKEVSK